MTEEKFNASAIVIRAWGDGKKAQVPDWVWALAEAIDAQTMRKVAHRLDYSPGAVSRVLHNKYDGNTTRIEEMVRGALLSETVMCPALDEITRDRCLDNQGPKGGPPFSSSMRARLYRACRSGCPHFRGSK